MDVVPTLGRQVRGPFRAAAPEGSAVALQIWTNPAVMGWSQLLLNSFRHWTGRELLERAGDPTYEAHALFQSPFVVVSHGMEEDPLLNYGNQVALELWELTWEQLVKTPSRLTAEPMNRAEREWMLEQAKTRGYLDTYQGVRIASTGRRFLVENALIWNVVDAEGQRVGQAATFSQWTWLT
ncbi:MAG: MEKHLA domain-containing protein [Nitrospiraceae bacterium]|nr:MEKHLA domain-containing protein [Nitrospiraceae bacterium]